MGMGVWGQFGDKRGDTHDSIRAEGLYTGVGAAAQHVVASVVIPTERAGIRNWESRLDRELPLGAVDVPIVSKFCKPSPQRVGCSECVMPESPAR